MPHSRLQPRNGPNGVVPVVFYRALVDVDLLHSSISFNEEIPTERILAALRKAEGACATGRWPPEGVTERNRYVLLTVRKIDAAICDEDWRERMRHTGERRSADEGADTPEAIREWVYGRFPGARQARRMGGVYRKCEFESAVLSSGVVSWSYRTFPDGQVPPGMTGEADAQTFVRGIVRADLALRAAARRG